MISLYRIIHTHHVYSSAHNHYLSYVHFTGCLRKHNECQNLFIHPCFYCIALASNVKFNWCVLHTQNDGSNDWHNQVIWIYIFACSRTKVRIKIRKRKRANQTSSYSTCRPSTVLSRAFTSRCETSSKTSVNSKQCSSREEACARPVLLHHRQRPIAKRYNYIFMYLLSLVCTYYPSV